MNLYVDGTTSHTKSFVAKEDFVHSNASLTLIMKDLDITFVLQFTYLGQSCLVREVPYNNWTMTNCGLLSFRT